MGDRTLWIEKCPNCGEDMECYDAPTCLLWVRCCEKCKWSDDRRYYESKDVTGSYIIQLLTSEDARDKGLLVDCPRCKLECGSMDVSLWGVCYDCYADCFDRGEE